MELLLCTSRDEDVKNGTIDTTKVERLREECKTKSAAKKYIRAYRALGYELYDEKTNKEYVGDLKTVYEAIDNFAVRNDLVQSSGGYSLTFRRYRDRYQHIERVINCELKISKHELDASNGHRILVFFERVGISIAALVALYILEIVTLMLSDIVNCFTPTDFETDTFYAVFDVLLYVFIGLCGLAIVVFLVLLIVDLSKPRYWISRAHGLVKKDRKLMAQQSQTDEPADEPATESGPRFVDIRDPEFSQLVAEYKKEHADEADDGPLKEGSSLSGDLNDSNNNVNDEAEEAQERRADIALRIIEKRENEEEAAEERGEKLADIDQQWFENTFKLCNILDELCKFLKPADAKVLKENETNLNNIRDILDILYNDYSSPEDSVVQAKIAEAIHKLGSEIFPKFEELQAAKEAVEAPAVMKFRVYRFYGDAKRMDEKTPGALKQYEDEKKDVQAALKGIGIKTLEKSLVDPGDMFKGKRYDLCEGTMDQIDELAEIVFPMGFFRCQTDDMDFDGEWRFQDSMPDGTELVSVYCDQKDREHRIARIKYDPILFKDFDCPTDKEYVYRYYPHFWDDGLVAHWDPVLDPNKFYGDERSCLRDLEKCIEQSLGVDVDDLYETRRYVEWTKDEDN